MKFISKAALILLALSPLATAQIIPVALDGNTTSEGWDQLTLRRQKSLDAAWNSYTGFPGTKPWPTPIVSNLGSGDSSLNKTSNAPMDMGGPYPAGESIYFGGYSTELNSDGGTLTITDSTPIEALKTIVFQIEIGEAWGYDFFNRELPVLSVNGGTAIAATYSGILSRVYLTTVTMPTGPEDVFTNTYLLQWDLSRFDQTITEFSISFTGVPHAQLYSLQLDQSDEYHQRLAAIPEPSTWVLISASGLLGIVFSKRRRKAA